EFRKSVLSVVIDEAHVISHWGADFHKKYGELGIIHALLPPGYELASINTGIPIVTMSATLPARVRKHVLTKLQFRTKFVNVNIGNDCLNVSITVRAIEHALNSYQDLDFIIPKDVKDVKDILKTFLYGDNVIKGINIEDHLQELLPPELCLSGAIRTYSAAFLKEYCKEFMCLFKFGVGCNLPDINLVVQWKLP
ncbi:hypothetical protein C8J56DRAFT_719777, partial [Mycena floridula]